MNVLSKFQKRVLVGKKISKSNTEVDAIVERLINVINYINSFDEDATLCFEDKEIAEIEIPSEFKALVLPKSIRFIVGDRRCVDLLERPIVKKAPCTYGEYTNTVLEFRAMYKIQGYGDLVKIGELRKDVSIFDIWEKCSIDIGGVEMCVAKNEDRFIPIKIDNQVGNYFKTYVFNQPAQTMADSYIDDLMIGRLPSNSNNFNSTK